jgi:hypothetical protein
MSPITHLQNNLIFLGDGLGHGLEIIRMFSEAAGLEIIELELLVTPEEIITACKKNRIY